MTAANMDSALAAEVMDAYSVHYARETGNTAKAEAIGILGDRLARNAHPRFGGDLMIIEVAKVDLLVAALHELTTVVCGMSCCELAEKALAAWERM